MSNVAVAAEESRTALVACITDVTPVLAQEWLERNAHNRKQRPPAIAKYARDMTAGNWTLSPDCIAFDTNGRLVNGQHRLLAIIASGTTQQLTILEGFPLEAIDNIDGGMLRTFGDKLGPCGRDEVDGRSLAAVVNFVHKWQVTGGRYNRANAVRPTTAEGFAVFDADPTLFRDATRLARTWTKGIAAPPALVGGLFVVFHRVACVGGEGTPLEFFDRASLGAELPARSPLLLLRNQLLNDRARRRHRHHVDVTALIIKAWNAYRENRELGTLKWVSAVEHFPTPV